MIEEGETINPRQDTTPDAERVRVELMRRAPMWKRAEEWNELTMERRDRIMADVRRRYPHADEDEIRTRFAARVLPREDVMRIFGWDPELEDN